MPPKRDWSQLPPELLHLVSKKLPDVGDFVRFRAVCTRWRSSAAVSDLPPQLPWLLGRRDAALSDKLCFFSLASQKTYVIRNCVGRSRLHASGASHGCIVSFDLSSMILSNPVNGTLVFLPPSPFPPWHQGVVYVPNPIWSDDFVVITTCLHDGLVAFCRPGDAKWTVMDGHKDLRAHAYHNGKFFANTTQGDTIVIDATTFSVVSVVPPPSKTDGDAGYLVISSGMLLQVIRSITTSVEMCRFDVYQLDFDRALQPKWIKIWSIGDRTLFFDDHAHGFSFDSNEFAGLRGNCIYFVYEKRTWVGTPYRYLYRYSLEDNNVDKIVPLPEMSRDTWLVPSLCKFMSI